MFIYLCLCMSACLPVYVSMCLCVCARACACLCTVCVCVRESCVCVYVCVRAYMTLILSPPPLPHEVRPLDKGFVGPETYIDISIYNPAPPPLSHMMCAPWTRVSSAQKCT